MIKRLTYKICKRYIQWADGFSYDFESNGEKWVVEQLSTMGFKTVFDVGLVRHGGVKFDKWHYALNDFNSGPNYIAVRAHDQQIIDAISAK